MTHAFAKLAFTPAVRAAQEIVGSRRAYSRMDEGEAHHHILSANETGFIGERDSFYMASVSETGWPYMQHRGGPAGFVRILDERTIGFADYAGNRQYVSVGNIGGNDRVSLFFMDYANRTRLKLLGRARVISSSETALFQQLAVPGYKAKVERGIVIIVEAFDWNCSQHIKPRFDETQVAELADTLKNRIAELEAKLAKIPELAAD